MTPTSGSRLTAGSWSHWTVHEHVLMTGAHQRNQERAMNLSILTTTEHGEVLPVSSVKEMCMLHFRWCVSVKSTPRKCGRNRSEILAAQHQNRGDILGWEERELTPNVHLGVASFQKKRS